MSDTIRDTPLPEGNPSASAMLGDLLNQLYSIGEEAKRIRKHEKLSPGGRASVQSIEAACNRSLHLIHRLSRLHPGFEFWFPPDA